MIINDFRFKKVYDHLTELSSFGGKALFIFNHGIGDLINFIPLVEDLKTRIPNIEFEIGIPEYRKVTKLHPNVINLRNDFTSKMNTWSKIFKIEYPEPDVQDKKSGIVKPYYCNKKEIGIPNFKWKPYRTDFKLNKDSKIVGVHFSGNTNAKLKNVRFDFMEGIWNEIKACGFVPFEIHMGSYNQPLNESCPSFINESNSLRFQKPNLDTMIDKIKECRFFFGIDSGPFYMAGTILGYENCVGMERRLKIRWYLPLLNLKTINVKNYKYGDVTKMFLRLC